MDAAVTVTVDGALPDDLRELRAWLVAEEGLRGRVQLVERVPEPGRLGPVLEALQVLAGPGSAVLASVLVTWIKQRRSSVKVTVTRPDGQRLSIEAEHARLMGTDDLAQLTAEVARLAQADNARSNPGIISSTE